MGPPFLLLVVVSLFLMVLMTNCQTATLQDTGLCGIVAATNIQSVIPEWSCDADGNPDSNVCSWSGLECNDNDEVISLSLVSYTLFGMDCKLASFSLDHNFLFVLCFLFY